MLIPHAFASFAVVLLSKAHEGAVVKSELVAMWKLKTTAMRAKLGNDERVVAAQLDALAAAPVPPSRAQPARTAKVIEQVRASGGGQTPNELLLELERQMVEAERWHSTLNGPSWGARLRCRGLPRGTSLAEGGPPNTPECRSRVALLTLRG